MKFYILETVPVNGACKLEAKNRTNFRTLKMKCHEYFLTQTLTIKSTGGGGVLDTRGTKKWRRDVSVCVLNWRYQGRDVKDLNSIVNYI